MNATILIALCAVGSFLGSALGVAFKYGSLTTSVAAQGERIEKCEEKDREQDARLNDTDIALARHGIISR